MIQNHTFQLIYSSCHVAVVFPQITSSLQFKMPPLNPRPRNAKHSTPTPTQQRPSSMPNTLYSAPRRIITDVNRV